MAAFHALLNNQRLLFLGHSQPAGGVCTAVLSVPLHVGNSALRRPASPRQVSWLRLAELADPGLGRRPRPPLALVTPARSCSGRIFVGGALRTGAAAGVPAAEQCAASLLPLHDAQQPRLPQRQGLRGWLDQPDLREPPRVVGRPHGHRHGQGARLHYGRQRQALLRRAKEARRDGRRAHGAGPHRSHCVT